MLIHVYRSHPWPFSLVPSPSSISLPTPSPVLIYSYSVLPTLFIFISCSFTSPFKPFVHPLYTCNEHILIYQTFFPLLSSSDGVHSISAQCILRVLIITEDMLGSSVTVRLQNMSQEHFLSPLLGNFLEGVSAVLSVPVEDVFIFNIQPDLDAAPGGILNVSFSAALPGGHFFPSEALEEQLYLNRLRLTSLTQMEVSQCIHKWLELVLKCKFILQVQTNIKLHHKTI